MPLSPCGIRHGPTRERLERIVATSGLSSSRSPRDFAQALMYPQNVTSPRGSVKDAPVDLKISVDHHRESKMFLDPVVASK